MEAGAVRPVGPAEPGWQPWTPPVPERSPSRALVLAGGGATGIAWEAGVVDGLREAGVDVTDVDTMIGTSAGSVVAAYLRSGTLDEEAFTRIADASPLTDLGRLGPGDATRFLRSALAADRAAGRAVVGRGALRARTAAEEDWIVVVAGNLVGHEWPEEPLWITAVDAETGTAVVLRRESGVPIDRAVAASCAVPGVFPPVTIAGRRYVDGGVRSVANADLAEGHDRVLVLAPIPLAFRGLDRPGPQVRRLRRRGTRALLLLPDAPAVRALGTNPLDRRRSAAALEAGRAQGRRAADRVRRLWTG
ncbi:MAG TPA: patatin-like phospholipase family protein [Dermatophilaceae bacterium]|nr:patatin-like phospholipase family protein [Dermatophilaceae bacterium]